MCDSAAPAIGGRAVLEGFDGIFNCFLKLSVEYLHVIVNAVRQSLSGNWKDLLNGKSLAQQCCQILVRQIADWLVPCSPQTIDQPAVPVRIDPGAKNVGDGDFIHGSRHLTVDVLAMSGGIAICNRGVLAGALQLVEIKWM